jgi:hypothetical protein
VTRAEAEELRERAWCECTEALAEAWKARDLALGVVNRAYERATDAAWNARTEALAKIPTELT